MELIFNASKPFDRIDHTLLFKTTQAAIPITQAAIFGMVLSHKYFEWGMSG